MIDSRVAQLERLAAGLCAASDILIEVSDRDWAWSPEKKTIRVARDDLHILGPEACAGIVAHEVGHAEISRYLLLESALAVRFPRPELAPLFFNAIEDPRAEAYMLRKFPGVRRWFVVADQAMNSQRSGPFPRCLSFLLEASRATRLGFELPSRQAPIAPETLEALRNTLPARRRYAEGFLPPADSQASSYETEVVPLLEQGQVACQSRAEQGIQVLSARAARHAVSEILPDFLHLWGLDAAYLARRISTSRALIQLIQSLISLEDPQECMRAAIAQLNLPAPGLVPGPDAIRLAEDLLAMALRSMCSSMRAAHPRRTSTGAPSHAVPPPRFRQPEAADGKLEYRVALREVASQVDLLATNLDRILQKRNRLAERSGWPSGSRLDLRKAMSFEADPRRYDELWKRKTVPDRRRTVFSLLVDLSGSMEGAKTAAALRGTVVFAETLSRLKIPFAVNGFQDVVIPLLGFRESFDDEARARIGEMPLEVAGTRPGGNNTPQYNDDGPCLKQAGDALLVEVADERVLVVISDGSPNGVSSSQRDLSEAVSSLGRSGVLLFGVGIGPDTEHVRSFYPNSIACVPVPSFAKTISELLHDVIVLRKITRNGASSYIPEEDPGDVLPF